MTAVHTDFQTEHSKAPSLVVQINNKTAGGHLGFNPDDARPSHQNLIWLVHVFIAVAFIGILLASFANYHRRKRSGRRHHGVSYVANPTGSRLFPISGGGQRSGAGGGGGGSSGGRQQGKTMAAMTIAMSQFHKKKTLFRTHSTRSDVYTSTTESRGQMEQFSPMFNC